MSQGIYMPEGLFNQNQHLSQSKSGMKQAMEMGLILQGSVTRCDSSHNLYCDIGAFKGMIYREEATLECGNNKEIAVISKVGKKVCFKIIGMEGENYILSRREAQTEALESFLGDLRNGDILQGKITHIEPFGVFVDIGCGNISLIGIENISV